MQKRMKNTYLPNIHYMLGTVLGTLFHLLFTTLLGNIQILQMWTLKFRELVCSTIRVKSSAISLLVFITANIYIKTLQCSPTPPFTEFTLPNQLGKHKQDLLNEQPSFYTWNWLFRKRNIGSLSKFLLLTIFLHFTFRIVERYITRMPII